MSKINITNGDGIGFATGLTLIFAAAKVFGFINWPWLYVFAPVLISALFAIAVLFIVLIGFVLVKVFFD